MATSRVLQHWKPAEENYAQFQQSFKWYSSYEGHDNGESKVDILERAKLRLREESNTGTKKFTQEQAWCVLKSRSKWDLASRLIWFISSNYSAMMRELVPPTNLDPKKSKSETTSTTGGSHQRLYRRICMPNSNSNRKPHNRRMRRGSRKT
uniref:Uncharacterized protein n=1 Tax=Tanacetum cinerariifolium TaxID=118510 RepID=A0A699IAG9_TANCI|nr:hypothetical protein [Tanacetum cinerariifolium]